jgi:hypothetical protein
MQRLSLLILLLAITYFISGFQKKDAFKSVTPEYRNFYGIAWDGSANDNLSYARQMGYDYVFYQKGMERDSLSNGLFFYLETPEYSIYPRRLDTKKQYSTSEIKFFETHYALMNHKSFPDNIARGWFMSPEAFTPQLDLQQQKVISWAIDSIIKYVKSIESRNPKFRFGGFAWDVPQPAGDFWDTIQKPGRQITLAHWTGGDSGIVHPGTRHDYTSYSDGRIEFYKQLYKETRKVYSHARFIMEPYRLYDDWIKVVRDRKDAREVTPDILTQERFGTEFADDDRIFESGLISRENVASTTPDRFSDADNRLYAAKAALQGSWFSWYGRFGGTGDMPRFKSIKEVPARLKLIRVIANWENLNGIPLGNRTWDGTTYHSPDAFASPDVIYAKQPRTGKILVVFLSVKGKLPIDKKDKITGIYSTDRLFKETSSAINKFNIRNNIIIPKDSTSFTQGYIIHLK